MCVWRVTDTENNDFICATESFARSIAHHLGVDAVRVDVLNPENCVLGRLFNAWVEVEVFSDGRRPKVGKFMISPPRNVLLDREPQALVSLDCFKEMKFCSGYAIQLDLYSKGPDNKDISPVLDGLVNILLAGLEKKKSLEEIEVAMVRWADDFY